MAVPRRFYDSLTVDFSAGRKIRPGRFFRCRENGGNIYPTPGRFCRTIGSICLVFETKAAPSMTAPPRLRDGMRKST